MGWGRLFTHTAATVTKFFSGGSSVTSHNVYTPPPRDYIGELRREYQQQINELRNQYSNVSPQITSAYANYTNSVNQKNKNSTTNLNLSNQITLLKATKTDKEQQLAEITAVNNNIQTQLIKKIEDFKNLLQENSEDTMLQDYITLFCLKISADLSLMYPDLAQELLHNINDVEINDILAQDETGRTAFDYALEINNEQLINKLVVEGALNQVNDQGYTRIHLAYLMGDNSLFNKLLSLNAKLNTFPINNKQSLIHQKIFYLLVTESNAYQESIGAIDVNTLKQNLILLINEIISNQPDVLDSCEENTHPFFTLIAFQQLEIISNLLSISLKFLKIKNDQGFTSLHYAAKHGHITVIDLLIKFGATFDYNYVGDTVLHTAANSGQNEVIVYLINKHGFRADTLNLNKMNILHSAAAYNQVSTIYFIINNKLLNSDSTFDNQSTSYGALHYGAEHGNLKSIKALVKLGVNVDYAYLEQAAFHSVCKYIHIHIITYFLNELKVNIDTGITKSETEIKWNQQTVSPISIAAEYSSTMFFYLIKLGINILAYKELLYSAAKGGQAEIVEFLIFKGFTDDGHYTNSAFYVACESGHLEIVKILLNHFGIDNYDCSDLKNNSSGLIAAARYNKADIVEYLLSQGWKYINAVDCYGDTALLAAAQQPGVFKHSLEFFENDTVRQFYIAKGNNCRSCHISKQLNILELLLEHPTIDKNICKNMGGISGYSCNALVRAAALKNFEVVAFLVIKYGFELNVKVFTETCRHISMGDLTYPKSFDPIEIARVDSARISTIKCLKTLHDLGFDTKNHENQSFLNFLFEHANVEKSFINEVTIYFDQLPNLDNALIYVSGHIN